MISAHNYPIMAVVNSQNTQVENDVKLLRKILITGLVFLTIASILNLSVCSRLNME